MEKVPLETQNPLRQNAPTSLHADTYKEVAASYPPRSTIEHGMNGHSTLEVNDRDCTLEFSDRDCNLELNQYADGRHTEKQVAVTAGAETADADADQADAKGLHSAADGKQDPESQSETGTVRRHRSHRREWIIFGSIFGVVILVVIIVPSVIFGIRNSRPEYKPPTSLYIA
ncbi:hypothetical protein N7491_006203 [Penicillium cf. griseofulvum]|uniref:Uncharacterized protein n=1 Tax=Penicillium cf. griseofulvum TaxID=2972120 RepID=A0A9W9IXF4_9EURO|nr:hypothetical protein N7472_010767 [Penicillium cf. griseofulvum]KAJ5429187.1 hypothetical protein N7491_006203 [Penicillium cf. griseofulvum]